MRLGEKLTTLCRERKWGRYDLLDVVPGVSKSTIDNWIRNRTRPDLTSALLLSRAFDVPLEWLADDQADAVPGPPLSDEERMLLELFRSLRADLPLGRALRALSLAAAPGGPEEMGQHIRVGGDPPKKKGVG